MADPTLASRYVKMVEFPFSDEEVPIWAVYHEAYDWDIGTFEIVHTTGITLPSAAAACQLALPILQQHSPPDERFVVAEMERLLEIAIQGGSRDILNNLDWNFWRTTWPAFENRIEDYFVEEMREDEDEILSAEELGYEPFVPSVPPSILSSLILASKACGYWLEHIAAMQQNSEGGGITWSLDQQFIYPQMDPEERHRAENRMLYERESLALSVVYAVLALAEYYDQITTPYGQPNYRFRFSWPDRMLEPISPRPYMRIPLSRPRWTELVERIQQWLRVWWYYYQSKRSMVLPAPHLLEPPQVTREGFWEPPPAVQFEILDDDLD